MGDVGPALFPPSRDPQCPETLVPLRVADLLAERPSEAPSLPPAEPPVPGRPPRVGADWAVGPGVHADQRRLARLERRVAVLGVAVAVSSTGALLAGSAAVGAVLIALL